MTRQVRRLSGLMLSLFAVLYVNLNVVQLLRANAIASHPSNQRIIIDEYRIQRGPIIAGQDPIAFSVETEDKLKYLRRYEPATSYAHLLGYYSVVFGRDGLEKAFNETLTGTPTEVVAQNLTELLAGRDPVGNAIRLTVDPAVQSAAQEALGDRLGAVVALEPRTGAVLAQVSSPSYDPNRLSSHRPKEIRDYWRRLQADRNQPLADRAVERRYQPGSAFKLIVAAAALERGIGPSAAFTDTASYTPPNTSIPIHNFGEDTCTGGGSITLGRALVVSCNVTFAQLGVRLGADALIAQAQRFGFNRQPPYDLPVTDSVIPRQLDRPATAQSAIGARDVQATALQMAMVAAAIANDGVLMRPHVVAEVLDAAGRRAGGADPAPWVAGPYTAQAVGAETAQTLLDLMIDVVEEGTGRRARIPGAVVGGKTGTADPGEGLSPHAWFVGFAGSRAPGGGLVPEVAVAVVLPNAGEGATGGVDAAPIARAVMAAALGHE